MRRATGTLQSTVRYLDAEWDSPEATHRRSVIRLLRQLADGDQIRYTADMPQEPAERAGERQRFAAPLFGRALQQLNYLYADPPRRQGVGDEWRQVYQQPTWDLAMRQVDYEARLGGTALGVVFPQGLWVYGADKYCALQWHEDPREIGAARVEWSDGHTHYLVRTQAGTTIHGHYDHETERIQWDSEELHYWAATALPNTYDTTLWQGKSPFTLDTCIAVRTINHLWDVLVECSRLERGQLILVGSDGDITLGPRTPITLEAAIQAAGYYVRPGSDLSAQLSVIQAALDALCVSWGLPQRSLVVRPSQSPLSAAVIAAGQHELRADRQLRTALGIIWERRLHEITAQAHGLDFDRGIFSVEYPAPQVPFTHAEHRNSLKFLKENDLVSDAYILRNLTAVPERDVPELLAQASRDADAHAERTIAKAGHAAGRPQERTGDDSPQAEGDKE